MSNTNAVDPAQTTPSPTTQPGAPAQTTDATSGDSKIAALEKQVNALSAALRREKTGTKPNQQQPTNQGTAQQQETLKARVEALEAERKDIEAERRTMSIRSAAAAAGVAEDRLDIFVDHVNAKHGERIKVDKRTVFAEDELGQPQELAGYIGALVQKLEFFKPPVQVPNAGAFNKGTPARAAGQKTIMDFTAIELSKMQREKPDDFRALVSASGI